MIDFFTIDAATTRILFCCIIFNLFVLLMFLLKKATPLFKVVVTYINIGYISACVYYSLSFYRSYITYTTDDITLEAILYLTFNFIFMCLPFCFLKTRTIKRLDDRGIRNILNGITIILFILSILPFLNNVVRLTTLSQADIVNAYEGKMEETFAPVYWSNQIKNYLQFFIAPLFFYHLSKGKKQKTYLYMISFTLVASAVGNLVGGGRGTLVNSVNYLVVCYVLFRNILTKRQKNVLRKISIAFGAIVFIAITAITFARNNYNTNKASKTRNIELAIATTLYLGQGPLDFSKQMYPSTVRTDGDNSFSLVKTFLGLKTFKENDDRREYWERKQTIDNYIFYTLIGDIYSDLGYSNTILFFIFISVTMSYYFKRQKKLSITIQTVIAISFYFEWLTMGFMTNCYKTYYAQFFILVTLIFNYILSKYQKYRIKKMKISLLSSPIVIGIAAIFGGA